MKKTAMIEFQWVEGSDTPARIISGQFNAWMVKYEADFPDFRITHMKVISGRNSSKQHVETMFIAYEYEG